MRHSAWRGAGIRSEFASKQTSSAAITPSADSAASQASPNAARAGVENRRSFFRVENGKANLIIAADKAEWRQLISVDLGNGDSVGVVTAWKWPDAFDGVNVSDLRRVQDSIAAGRWRENSQAKNWAGHAVAAVLKLDTANKAHRAKIGRLLKTWISTGMLTVVEGLDDKREKRSFVEVGILADD